MSLTRESLAPILTQAQETAKQIDSIDEQLNVEGSTKTRVLNAAADNVVDTFGSLADQVRSAIDEVHGVDRIGVIALIRRELSNFDEEVKKYVEDNKTEGPTVSVEEQVRLREERKNLVGAITAIRDLLSRMAPDLVSEVPEYKNLRGAVGGTGTRGPRLKGTWTFAVGGVEIAGRTLGDVKAAVGASSVADVRTAIQAAHPTFDFDDPPSSFSFEVNGKMVQARTAESDPGDELDEADVDSEDNDDIFGDGN